MCGLYLLAAIYVVLMNIAEMPRLLRLIIIEAFQPTQAAGAFLGGTAGYALLWGMKRALFSSEAGQGSSPIAHSAAKTDEPAREGVVAGLEPFIDTLVVCTLTALVILTSGTWNREPEAVYQQPMQIISVAGRENTFTLQATEPLPRKTPEGRRAGGPWRGGETVFTIVEHGINPNSGLALHKVYGHAVLDESATAASDVDRYRVVWDTFVTERGVTPKLLHSGVWVDYSGASLTGFAFDTVQPGMGKWLVVVASWLFAVSTMISWSYYGEQGVYYLFRWAGARTKDTIILVYKFVYCLIIAITTVGFIRTDAELDAFTALGTGVMLWANIPIMLIFGSVAMRAYLDYINRLKSGQLDIGAHPPASISDVVEGRDVE
jgi:AGCS family alanine or glycine:cation symporter